MPDDTDYWGEYPAVLVVDMTRSLADPDVESSLDAGVEAARETRELLGVARAAGLPVFFSAGGKNYHRSTGADLTDVERGCWVEKSSMRDEDADTARLHRTVSPKLEPRDDEVIITKSQPSAFFGTMLDVYLSSLGVDTLVVTGMMTSGCVRATVTDAFSHGYTVVLPRETLADSTPAAHGFHVEEMGRKYAWVEPVADVKTRLGSDRTDGDSGT